MSRRVMLLGLVSLMAGVVLFAGVASARGQNVYVKTSTKPQSGIRSNLATPARINAAGEPFRFKRTSRITKLRSVTITATIFDGDTEVGNFDHGDLFLGLDGINTGIKLNGYHDKQTDTRTNGGHPENADKLLKALKRDGKLNATIIDVPAGHHNKVRIPAQFNTTLKIKGVRGR